MSKLKRFTIRAIITIVASILYTITYWLVASLVVGNLDDAIMLMRNIDNSLYYISEATFVLAVGLGAAVLSAIKIDTTKYMTSSGALFWQTIVTAILTYALHELSFIVLG